MTMARLIKAVMALIGSVTLFVFWENGPDIALAKPSGMRWSDMEKKYEGAFVLSAHGDTRKVALTFDDVPDPRFTPQVLDVLRRKKVTATFFVVGTRAKKHPDIVSRIRKEGHDIGNHSYSHPDFSKLPLAKVQDQIGRAEAIIDGIVGFKPRLVRPPYGEITETQLRWAKQQGYTVVNWNVDSSDWRQLSAKQILRNVTRSVRPGAVVLMHAGGGEGQNLSGTVQALPALIDWLRLHRYEPVSLSELLGVKEYKS
ncbi:polysaccharide deacetylase family protein [Cohnella suwonensis]|uniref:Polysaccharide deacetylase family protein n=1 Tax=Cohnella suwonensis TaxID=696072 RepID=A0ABW0LXG2_9BACL